MDGALLIQKETNKTEYTPLVSVIIATFRRNDSLEKSLYSLATQTYKYIEIIVVDDNADGEWNVKVMNIINTFENRFKLNIIYIKNIVNKGSAETRNVGIKAATGVFITFLDDDDIYLPKKIENQILNMIKEQSDYCITDLELYNEKDKLVEKRIRNYIKMVDSEQLLKYHLMYHMTGTDTLMFKKRYLQKIGGFPHIDIGDEFYLMESAILNKGRFSYSPGCDVKAYIHSETDGLSSGEKKIQGENVLYSYKMQYFSRLSFKEKRYIKMRHNAVIAFAELRKPNMIGFFKNSFLSFFSSPYQCIKLILNRK